MGAKKAKKAAKKVVKKAKKVAKKVVKKAKKVVKKGKKVVKKHIKVHIEVHKKPAAKKPAAKKCNVSKNGRCGAKFGHTICAWGYCSRWNWCGTSKLHKSTHQPKYDARKECAAKKAKKV